MAASIISLSQSRESGSTKTRWGWSRCAWIFAGLAGVVALVLWGFALRSSSMGSRLAGVFELPAEAYQKGHATARFKLSGEEPLVRLEVASPVENSWLKLHVRVVNASGLTVRRQLLNLSYYHGTSEGRSWVTGRQKAAELLELPPGEYHLVVNGEAGGGVSSTSETERFGQPVRIAVRADSGAFRSLIWLSCITSLVTLALVLCLLSRRDHSKGDRAEASQRAGRPERFVMIDGLRGMAALAVLFCHLAVPEICRFSGVLTSALPSPLPGLLRHGDLGVEVFFVLSGFVMAYSVRDRIVTPAFAGRFALRRAVRLDPPYYLTILVSVAIWAYYLPSGLTQVVDEVGGAPGVLANVFYLQDLLGFTSPVSIAWTLCLEVQFYLAFIGLLWISQATAARLPRLGVSSTGDRGQTRAVVLAFVFVPLVALSLSLWYPRADRFDFLGTWFRFFLGVTVFWVLSGRVSRWWLVVFALVLTIMGAATWDSRSLAALATALLIDAAGRAGTLTKWLSSWWTQFLGRISYSLYLVHIPIGVGAANIVWSRLEHSTGVAVACAALAVAASLTAAHFVHVVFEAPSIRVSKRIGY
jgi:peptidoglycan/LPS O-acetylase OafA/YrhL